VATGEAYDLEYMVVLVAGPFICGPTINIPNAGPHALKYNLPYNWPVWPPTHFTCWLSVCTPRIIGFKTGLIVNDLYFAMCNAVFVAVIDWDMLRGGFNAYAGCMRISDGYGSGFAMSSVNATTYLTVALELGVGMGEDAVPLIDDCRCDKYPSLNHNST
jgi:hypothetical protein